MTKLIVVPIDLNAPGSYRERKQFLKLLRNIRQLEGTNDPEAILDAFEEADGLIRGRLKTEDGTPVEDVLEQLSARDFDQLLASLAFENVVPPESASS